VFNRELMSKGIAVRAVLLTGAIIIAFALGAALALRGMLPAIPGVTGKALQESPAAAKAKAAGVLHACGEA
jgi:hypothetical protein